MQNQFAKAKPSKLAFKRPVGQSKSASPYAKPAKKVKRKSTLEIDAINAMPDEGWLVADTIDDISGPLQIVSTSGQGRPLVLNCGRMGSDKSADGGGVELTVSNADALIEVSPSHVQQVLQAIPLPRYISSFEYPSTNATDSVDGQDSVFAFKTAEDLYLSCDKFSSVKADKPAVGPQEQWTLIRRMDGFAIQSTTYQLFLQAVPSVGGSLNTFDGQLQNAGSVRCDSPEVGSREVWQIKCQAADKKKRLLQNLMKVKSDSQQIDVTDLERQELLRLHSFGERDFGSVPADKRELLTARDSGIIHEAMLDRRVKLKSDRYCK